MRAVTGVCAAVQDVAGVVVEPGEDLDVGVVGEPVVGEVGLPTLVGHRGLEADVGGLRTLLRRGGDQALASQDPRDGRDRDDGLVVVLEVPGQGRRPGVQAGLDQFLTKPHDELDRRLWGRVRRA
jgi:hypothetical protein